MPHPELLKRGIVAPLPQLLLLLVCALLLSRPALAQQDDDAAELLRAARCYACHDLSKPLLGPPWQAIAARHAGKADLMTDILARKIVLGGGGNWGVVPMVPNEHVDADTARKLARWILQQAPQAESTR